MPVWLLWLLPAPVAALLALAWARWTSRARGPAAPQDSIASYARFREALAEPSPGPGRRRRR